MKKLSFIANIGLGQEKEYFIEQLSMLLAAGMPVITALSAIKKEIKSKALQALIASISVDIEAGSSISSAITNASVFPPATISLIRIGEQSGRLSENLKAVVDQQQKDKEFRSKATSAMMYPFFVFFLTIIVGLGIAWFILPGLATVFTQLKVELPLVTRWLIGFGIFLGHYGSIVIPLFILFNLLVIFFLFVLPQTNFLGQTILFTTPPIAQLFIQLELSRFGSLLGNLLEAGLPILDSLNSLTQSATFSRYRRLYSHLHDRIAEGNSFGKSFETYHRTDKLIPIPIQQLIIASEQSGNLPATFKKIGEIYEAKTEATTKNITVLLEPILLVVVWLGVVAVALAVILPLYSLIGNFNVSSSPSSPTQSINIPSPVPITPVQLKKIKILSTELGFLNVRDQPSKTAKIIGQLKPDEIYEFVDQKEQWYQINLDSNPGWVSAKYVQEI